MLKDLTLHNLFTHLSQTIITKIINFIQQITKPHINNNNCPHLIKNSMYTNINLLISYCLFDTHNHTTFSRSTPTTSPHSTSLADLSLYRFHNPRTSYPCFPFLDSLNASTFTHPHHIRTPYSRSSTPFLLFALPANLTLSLSPTPVSPT